MQSPMAPIKEEVFREHAKYQLENQLHSIWERLELCFIWHTLDVNLNIR